ncbi:McrC family protein [Demequina maris]|uniref:McrC family protein n=1 Tax=Demequina maris TaxID=1638982 RepID=UPI0007836BDC|nr:restriction endonuclease [Demequina maris]
MTATGRIVLSELDREGTLLTVASPLAERLARTRLVEVRPEGSAWRIVPSGRVGSVRVGGLELVVRPKDKVGLSRLLFLLGYARDPGFDASDVSGDQDDDLWPALAESLVRQIRRALGPGVLQGYITVDDSLRTVRGRIRIGDQITRRPGRMIPIEVSHDEYTVDIAENRLLRSAIRRMLTVPRLRPDWRASLAHLDGQLGGVSVLTPGAPLPSWSVTRMNARYVPALRLAEIVLRHASSESRAGDDAVAGFVVDMAAVYEDFVETALREALASLPGTTRGQYPCRLDEPDGYSTPPISMYVDVVQTVRGMPTMIFDAKYKASDSGGRYPNADHYQMLAYCTALGIPTAWLVYAGPGSPRTRRIVNSVVNVVEYPLDLSLPPARLLRRVQALADDAWARACLRGSESIVIPDPDRTR